MERIDKLKDMLKGASGDCFLLHALGLEYIKLGEYHTGIGYFEEVLRQNPSYVGTYYHLAKAFEHLSEREKAIQTYEKGIEIAQSLKDQHAKNELQMALDDLEDM